MSRLREDDRVTITVSGVVSGNTFDGGASVHLDGGNCSTVFTADELDMAIVACIPRPLRVGDLVTEPGTQTTHEIACTRRAYADGDEVVTWSRDGGFRDRMAVTVEGWARVDRTSFGQAMNHPDAAPPRPFDASRIRPLRQ